MRTGEPSRTAFSAARHRAIHQLADQGRIFADPLAVRILGEGFDQDLPDADIESGGPMRTFIALRSRIADDAVTAAVSRGVRQFVVLGAGLDTTAYRRGWPGDARVFEVDHPATQEWKRDRLLACGIVIPSALRLVAVDFEFDVLGEHLAAAGFDASRPSFFVWLGVVPYLTHEAILATLHFTGALKGGSEIVFDYGNPVEMLSPERRQAREAMQARVGALGEPWISHFETPALHGMLRGAGFGHIDDLEAGHAAARYLANHEPRDNGHGGHIVHAATTDARVERNLRLRHDELDTGC